MGRWPSHPPPPPPPPSSLAGGEALDRVGHDMVLVPAARGPAHKLEPQLAEVASPEGAGSAGASGGAGVAPGLDFAVSAQPAEQTLSVALQTVPAMGPGQVCQIPAVSPGPRRVSLFAK